MTHDDQGTPGAPPATAKAAADAAPPSEFPSGIADFASALSEVDRLQRRLAAAEAREQVLTEELQHRTRNLLATIRSVYRQSRASGTDHEAFAGHFAGRLDAIARSQSYPGGVRAAGIEIEDMVRDELLAIHCLDGPRCSIEGPPVRLRDRQAELMGLAIHELATNAVKFGALAQDGTLSITWSIGTEGLRFRWSEQGVSVTSSAPRPTGFGRQVIEEALPYQIGATTSFCLRPGGIECTIELPLPDHEPGRQDVQENAIDDDPLLPPQLDDLP